MGDRTDIQLTPSKLRSLAALADRLDQGRISPVEFEKQSQLILNRTSNSH